MLDILFMTEYYSKHLAIFQQSLLNTTQSWNKYKNRAIKFEQEKKELLTILENPEKRRIFFEVFDDKKIADITTNIFNYKINIKNKDFIGALACLKQINF